MSRDAVAQAMGEWLMESCDACHAPFFASRLTPVILADSTGELRCDACVDDLRLELLADGGVS